jgi:hypothetical protein
MEMFPQIQEHFLYANSCRGYRGHKSCHVEDIISSRDSARLQAGRSGVRVPAGAGNFSLHHRVQTGHGVHPAS